MSVIIHFCPRSGLEQEDMRVLYRYLTTSLIPVANEEVPYIAPKNYFIFQKCKFLRLVFGH